MEELKMKIKKYKDYNIIIHNYKTPIALGIITEFYIQKEGYGFIQHCISIENLKKHNIESFIKSNIDDWIKLYDETLEKLEEA